MTRYQNENPLWGKVSINGDLEKTIKISLRSSEMHLPENSELDKTTCRATLVAQW